MKTHLFAALFSSLLLFSCGGGGGTAGSTTLSGSGGSGGGTGGTGGTGGATGSINIEVTDAPFDIALVKSAIVIIDRIDVFVADSDSGDSQKIKMNLQEPFEFDLVALRNGVTEFMLKDTLPAGQISQMRLVVESGEIELLNGNTYTTADGTLKLSSQAKSGFKVFIDPPIEIVAKERTDVILDFDLSKTFKAIPPNDPANAKFFKLHPVLRAVNKAMTGEMHGMAEESDGSGGMRPADRVTIHLMERGELDPSLSIATTISESDGSFGLIGVEPGLYDLIAVKALATGRNDSVSVSVGETVVSDIVVQ